MKQPTAFRVFSLLTLAWLAFSGTAGACGMLTHGEIVYRGAFWFADPDHPEYEGWLSGHTGALLAGSAFPDWGWFTGYFAEAEVAHGGTFYNAAADHFAATYPKPWTPEVEKTAVFILGLSSHVVSDSRYTMHRQKGYEEGFLGVMGYMEFPGSFDAAHHIGDVGGDSFTAYQYDLSYVDTWYVPTVDMAQVYNDLGYAQVTPQLLETATNLMYIASLVERALFPYLHDVFSRLTIFQKEHHQDFFAGGLDDMGINCAWTWNDLIDRIEDGAKGEPASSLPLMPHSEKGEQMRQWVRIGQAMIDAGDLIVAPERTENGVIFRASFTSFPDVHLAKDESPQGMDRTLTFVNDAPYGYLGNSLTAGDFNGDGLADLAMGSPGYSLRGEPQLGRVDVVFSGGTVDGHETVDFSAAPADVELASTEIYGRFGWSLAVVDLNKDGIDDLAVSAPTVGAVTDSYNGRIEVYFGTGDAQGLSAAADLTIESAEHRHNLGWRLASGDLDGDGYADLLIGSPFASSGGYQRGEIAVFFSARNLPSGATLTPADAGWRLSGENDYDWFGYAVAAADFGDAGAFLLVGAPAVDDGGTLSVGRLYGYDAASPSAVPSFTVTGEDRFDKTGAAFAVFSPFGDGEVYLALASITRSSGDGYQGGTVHLIAADDLADDKTLDQLTSATVFSGDQSFARLGWSIGVADYNGDGIDDLWLTEPFRETEAGFEAGAAHLFYGGDSFPLGAVESPSQEAHWSIPYDAKQSLFGGEIAFPDYDGDGTGDVAFGARRATDQARNGGRVIVIPSPVPGLLSLEPSEVEVGKEQTFTLTGVRLLDEDLAVELEKDGIVLSPTSIAINDASSLEFLLEIPGNAAVGDYDVHLSNLFGEATLPSGLTVTSSPEPDDDEDADLNAQMTIQTAIRLREDLVERWTATTQIRR